MFVLPSIWNILISTLFFMFVAWYLKNLLEEQGLPRGITRSLLVFILAYAVSWVSGELVDWLQVKSEGQKSEQKLDLGIKVP